MALRKFGEDYTVRKPYIVCFVAIGTDRDAPEDYVVGVGFSKMAKGDKWDPQYGRDLALMRAMRDATSNYYDKRIEKLTNRKFPRDLHSPEKCVQYTQDSVTVTDATTWQIEQAREARLDEMIQILIDDGVVPFGIEEED
jgi:hypothetical protein